MSSSSRLQDVCRAYFTTLKSTTYTKCILIFISILLQRSLNQGVVRFKLLLQLRRVNLAESLILLIASNFIEASENISVAGEWGGLNERKVKKRMITLR